MAVAAQAGRSYVGGRRPQVRGLRRDPGATKGATGMYPGKPTDRSRARGLCVPSEMTAAGRTGAAHEDYR